MQTVTHLAVGALLGAAAFPHEPIMQLACAAGAVAPDLVMVPAFAWDVLCGRQPLKEQGPVVMALKHASHSAFLWPALLALGYAAGWWLALAFALGGVSHILIDVFTHGDPAFNEHDALYLWPLQRKPFNIGTWDYRVDYGIVWPLKPFEVIVFVVSIAGTVWLWVAQAVA